MQKYKNLKAERKLFAAKFLFMQQKLTKSTIQHLQYCNVWIATKKWISAQFRANIVILKKFQYNSKDSNTISEILYRVIANFFVKLFASMKYSIIINSTVLLEKILLNFYAIHKLKSIQIYLLRKAFKIALHIIIEINYFSYV